MATPPSVEVGDLIEITDGRRGTVRFTGRTDFAEGDWIGVELEETSGKNDGLVQNRRYFRCEPFRGIFIRGTAVESNMGRAPSKQPPSAANGTAPKGRPQSTSTLTNGRRQSVMPTSAAKRQSMAAQSPTPASRMVCRNCSCVVSRY